MTFRGEQDARDADRWFRWMLLFGGLGILATVGLQFLAFAWCDRDESRKSHDWMKDQMQRLRQGEINCLVDPDPRSLEELLADAAAAAAVRDVYLGGDLSDPRLAGLRELPNLKCIVFIFADHHKEFLQRMHGAAAIEELSFDCTPLERADVDQIASFPHLKALAIGSDSPWMSQQARLSVSDLDALRGHPSLERLYSAPGGEGIDALLQSLPRLREPSGGHAAAEE